MLRAVVEEYVRDGEPVGCETIAEHAGLGVSSATIRNEMAALEELGYLTHPHTSAGRIPTDVGYRHYVDSLPGGGKLRDAQRRAIAGYFAEAIVDLEEVLKGCVQLLSRLTQYAGLAVPPSAAEEPIVRVELIDMGPTVMILAVGQHGRVDKRVIDRPDECRRGEPGATPTGVCRRCAGSTYIEAQARLLQLAAEGSAAPARPRCCTWRRRCGSRRRESVSAHVVVGGVVEPRRRGAAWRRETAATPVRDPRARAGDARRAGRT